MLGLKLDVCTNSTPPETCAVVVSVETDISLVGVKTIWALVPSPTTLVLTSARSSMLPPMPPMIGSEINVSETEQFWSMISDIFEPQPIAISHNNMAMPCTNTGNNGKT